MKTYIKYWLFFLMLLFPLNASADFTLVHDIYLKMPPVKAEAYQVFRLSEKKELLSVVTDPSGYIIVYQEVVDTITIGVQTFPEGQMYTDDYESALVQEIKTEMIRRLQGDVYTSIFNTSHLTDEQSRLMLNHLWDLRDMLDDVISFDIPGEAVVTDFMMAVKNVNNTLSQLILVSHDPSRAIEFSERWFRIYDGFWRCK